MTLFLLLLALAQSPCDVGGKGAQCVTCTPSDRGTVVCRGVCYFKDPKAPRPDGGFRSASLGGPGKGEANTEAEARAKVDAQAKKECP